MQRSPSSNSLDGEDTKPITKIEDYHVSKSRITSVINWLHVFRLYLPLVGFTAIGVVVVQLATTLYKLRFDLQQFVSTEMPIIQVHRMTLTDLGWQFFVLLALVIFVLNRTEKAVYLVDFACFEPPESWRITYDQMMKVLEMQGCYTAESLDFMRRMLERSGCGPRTAWPPAIMDVLAGGGAKAMKTGTEDAREESRVVMNDCVKNVLEANKVNPKDIDILIVNCSLFSPTPSLCAMIINDFGMRSDILSYNLSGMGCSAGIISIDLAKRLMIGRPNSLCLVVSTENLTQALYRGNDRAFLMQNILFRVGGAAVLMSNRWGDAFRSQFKLLTSVRTQYVTEESVGCVYDTEDSEGKHGVRLSKEIVKVAGRALEKNFTSLGPHVLPLSEQFKVVVSMIWKFISKKMGKKVDMYIPDFKRGVHYFCIHAGGRGVIDGIEKNLNLSPHHVAASRHALYTYGNTSSSSIWYEMDYIRNQLNLKRGERVLQVAFGSGFKCNSAVWLCINPRKIKQRAEENAKAARVRAESEAAVSGTKPAVASKSDTKKDNGTNLLRMCVRCLRDGADLLPWERAAVASRVHLGDDADASATTTTSAYGGVNTTEEDETRSVYSLDARRHVDINTYISPLASMDAAPSLSTAAANEVSTPMRPYQKKSTQVWRRQLADKLGVFSSSLIAGNLALSLYSKASFFFHSSSAAAETISAIGLHVVPDTTEAAMGLSLDALCLFLGSIHAWAIIRRYLDNNHGSTYGYTDAAMSVVAAITSTDPLVPEDALQASVTTERSTKRPLLAQPIRLITPDDMSSILSNRRNDAVALPLVVLNWNGDDDSNRTTIASTDQQVLGIAEVTKRKRRNKKAISDNAMFAVFECSAKD